MLNLERILMRFLEPCGRETTAMMAQKSFAFSTKPGVLYSQTAVVSRLESGNSGTVHFGSHIAAF